MKIGWLILGAGVAYIAYKSYMVNRAINTFNYSVKSVRVNASNSNIFKTELAVTLTVNNVTSQPIQFQRFVGTLNIKGVPVAAFNIFNTSDVIIKPGSNEIMFPVTINHLSLAADITNIINDWKQDQDESLVSVKGDITVAGLSLPINQTLFLNQDATINGTGDEEIISSLEIFGFSNY